MDEISNLEKIRVLTEKLTQMEDDLTRLFKYAPVLFCIGNKTDTLYKVNPQWTKVFGWTEEELTTRPWVSFLHPDDIEKTEALVTKLYFVDAIGFKNRFRTKSGEYLNLTWYMSSWINERNYSIAVIE